MNQTISSISVARENELQERDFYLRHSRRTRNPVGRAIFEYIAHDEEEHYQRLKALHQHLTATGAWPETLSVTIQDTNILDILLRTASAARSDAPADPDDREALAIAIEFETKGYTFYTSLSKSAESVLEKKFFDHLASMEREHLNSLRETLLYFENPHDWFAQREKPLLEG